MQLLCSTRASSLLYSFLHSQKGEGVWMIPVNVCHLLPATLIKAEKSFEIIDVCKKTLDIDEEFILEQISNNPKRYAGLLSVRSYGKETANQVFFQQIKAIAPHLKIIDDACLSFPNLESQLPKEVDLELYSTGYSKPVDLGYGGFGKFQTDLSNEHLDEVFDENYLNQINTHYVQSMKKQERVDFQLFKTNWLNLGAIDEVNYVEQIKLSIDEARKHKHQINEVYNSLLKPSLREKRLSSNWRYSIRVSNPEVVLNEITNNGLFASQHYFPLNKVFGHSSCPNWERVFDSLINLFNDSRFTVEQAEMCCKIINQSAEEVTHL